ncbi:MAG: thymidylate synthase [Candidatus Magasanikbacteria bacterium]|jgi:thymidylate synthase|nr:thymidylate synthase [Candidatus Magasanikbacteria bacterium]MBT4315159.1 thymidylate synthase [Candidatus Magasanikbacteria bacterium]MBT4547385.1 thymidylate synthase [Candidatus Magasanikbacteria bacterium]MBT6819084.1 thymidylate synthase [Candidatus Magasanikbacteria bacterium]
MQSYLNIVKNILENGTEKADRTGTGVKSVAGVMFEHDMSTGFPLLTTKKMPFKVMAAELEFFIKGLTDKQWLKDRNCHIWDDWCSPDKVPYAHDEETKKKMAEERDLGPIYGFQWRHFNADYKNYDTDYTRQGVDQFKKLINTIKNNPTDRRMMVMAWNPAMLEHMALPPCHYNFQITITGDKLNLMWNQRSVDVALGLPFNISSYALLLHLLAKETGYKEGRLVGFLGDTHIYSNHSEGMKEQLERDPNKYSLPHVETENFTSIFDWEYTDSKIVGYESYDRIKFPIAI